MDYRKSAQDVLRLIGGKENLISAAHCATRLRLVIADNKKCNKEALDDVDGVKGVFEASGQLQIIFGTGVVNKVYDEFIALAGVSAASKEDVKQAAAIAQATEFIEEKEGTYEAPIAQGGTNVSGGQKQRLSIARAIAKKPEILIFDDSFSALDYKTDVTLRRELKKQTADTTTLIVAQRISTILHADLIIVLDDGKIAGKGTHKELMENCEVYRQIAKSQLSEKELAG